MQKVQLRTGDYLVTCMYEVRKALQLQGGDLLKLDDARVAALMAEERAVLAPELGALDRAECKIVMLRYKRQHEAFNAIPKEALLNSPNAPTFFRHHAHRFAHLTLTNVELLHLVYNYLKVEKAARAAGNTLDLTGPQTVHNLVDAHAQYQLSPDKLFLFTEEEVNALLAQEAA
jgi:hypothetical protein